MSSDPWRKYMEARAEALRVYKKTIKPTQDVFCVVNTEATQVYLNNLKKLRFEFKEASL